MKKLVLALLALLALVGPVAAADLAPVYKAPSWTNFPYNGSGFYWGVDTEAGVASASGSGTFAGAFASGNLIADGGVVGGSLGYIRGNGTSWVALQGNLDYQNITTTTTNLGAPASVASRWQASQVVKVGGLSWLVPTLSNLGINFPTLPALPVVPGAISVTGTSHPYIMGGVQEFGLSGTFGGVGGTTWGVAPLVGAGVLYQVVDTTGKLTGAVVDTYAKVVFSDRGVAINGLFAPGSPTFGGQLSMGTQYFGGVALYW